MSDTQHPKSFEQRLNEGDPEALQQADKAMKEVREALGTVQDQIKAYEAEHKEAISALRGRDNLVSFAKKITLDALHQVYAEALANSLWKELQNIAAEKPNTTEEKTNQKYYDFIGLLGFTDVIEMYEYLNISDIERAKEIKYPIDKPNAELWYLLKEDTGGQLTINFDVMRSASKRKDKAPINIVFAIDFDSAIINKTLSAYDKRVYIAAGAVYAENRTNTNGYVTATQIHYAMGNTKRPSAKQLEKINESLTKMTAARIYVDNGEEAEVYNYQHFVYDGSMLPFERVSKYVNGTFSDGVIHMFREPPLISFAKERKQFTTFNVALLQSDVSKTESNLRLEDYLIERISREKNKEKTKGFKILFSTLYEQTDIKPGKERTRAIDKINTYLDHYKSLDFIKEYAIEKEYIKIVL